MSIELDKMRLLYGGDYPLTSNLRVRHPTLREMIEYKSAQADGGYNYFMSLMTNFVIKPEDIADVLWVEEHILYTQFKTPWEFFIERAYGGGTEIEIYEDYQGQVIKTTTRCADSFTEECLNYFFNKQGHYVFTVKNKKQIESADKDNPTEENTVEEITLCNVALDGKITQDAFKFTEPLYHLFVKYLNTIMWDSGVPLFLQELNSKNPNNPVKITSNILLKALLEDAYLKRNSKKKISFTMESIVSAIIAENSCYKDIWDYPIYVVNDQYHRLNKIKAYNSTMDALNSGYYDVKKHPINWEKVDWASVISIN